VQGEESNHAVEGFFSYGPLNSDIQPRYVRQHVAFLSYSYLRSLGIFMPGRHPLRFSVGAGISSLLTFTDFNTTDETGYTTFDQSWLWSHSLNVILCGEYELDSQKSLTVQVTTPVAALVSRPENERWMSANNSKVIHDYFKAAAQGKMEYLWDNAVVSASIQYRQSLGGQFDVVGTYAFRYVGSGRPAPILSTRMYMNNLLVGVSWRIR
jgi:hypothetical protein